MKFIVEVDSPLEPFKAYGCHRTARKRLARYSALLSRGHLFTRNGVARGAVMVIDLDSAGQAPHVTQPLMLNSAASVHYRFAMPSGGLQCAGLDRHLAA